MPRRLMMMCLCLCLVSPSSFAGEPINIAVEIDELATLFNQMYGPGGLVVQSMAVLASGDTHSAHFNSSFQSEFTQFSTALTSQLTLIPLPSPASGFTYEFDSSLGVFTRSTQSFGPILAERAETLGQGRFSFGVTFQNFRFDTIDGMDMSNLPAVFTHDGFELRGGREDVVTTVNSFDVTVNQFTGFFSYGLTDRLDVSLAIPVVSNDMKVVSSAQVARIGTDDQEIHFFRESDDSIGERRIFTAFGSASGLGDITVRLKGNVVRGTMALGLDLRIPTGNEKDLLGTGAAAAKPFLVLSSSHAAFSPHLNLGYQWNGSSTLAGDPAAGVSRDLPDHGFFTVGADMGVGKRLTLALDVLGQYLLDAPRVRLVDFHALDGTSVFPNLQFVNEDYLILSGAVGFKFNVVADMLVDFNLLFNLNDNGMRDKITPLIGIEYGF